VERVKALPRNMQRNAAAADPESYPPWPALSLLFVVFALGALFDPTRPPFSIESQEYYLLSRVTLINFAQPIFKTTICSVLTLVRPPPSRFPIFGAVCWIGLFE